MPINYAPFVVGRPDETEAVEIGRVEQIAKDLLGELRRISDEIDRVHRWRAKSDDIQKLFFGWLADSYDIVTESTEGFEDTTVHRVRPDAQILLNLEGTRRILVEVERGGAVTNGHDLKDMWKAHLSPLVQHLFLVVPNSINDEKGAPRSDQAFLRSTARLSSFFRDCRTEVDVLSVHVFGCGPERVRQAQVETRLPQR
jgi:hypothetical protein